MFKSLVIFNVPSNCWGLETRQSLIVEYCKLAALQPSSSKATAITEIRIWRKLHIAVDISTHEMVAAELSLSNVTDVEVLPNLLHQTRRKSLKYRLMVLMTLGIAMTPYGSSERSHLSRYEKGQPSGNEDTLEI